MSSTTSESLELAAHPEKPRRRRSIYRHKAVVRVTHWINVVCMTILLMSGLQIFNAHPALYWGDRSTFGQPLLAMGKTKDAMGHTTAITAILGHAFDTSDVPGLSGGGFPSWATLPGQQWLAMGRR
ncbi:MAG: cytochrome b/b6 domain-containing protein, partial [Acidimicrobiales bacterium]